MKVVVAGGGIGGLELINNLRGLDVTLVEPRERMVCQALLPEYIVGKVGDDEVSISIPEFCDRHGVNWVRDAVLKVEGNRVITERDEIEFDCLVISIGAKPFVFENTCSLGNLEDAKMCKKAVEDAESVVVIGSGATGVECAFELREMGLNVTLVEYLDRVLPTFNPRVSSYVKKLLEKEGVKVATSCKVIGVNEVVKTNKGDLDCDVAISCAGVIPNTIEGLRREKGGIVVDEYLRARENVFAIGDCALVKVNGKIATKTAFEAEMQARYTAKNLMRIANNESLVKYKIHSSVDRPIAFITLARERAILIYKGIFIPKPMKILYKVKKRVLEEFMKRYKV
ncbi:NAD(P)/FAD-dependent oxidoreductase [Archaeoglobus profundus]|uniref:FAD-dependent pyridine nucleotide-disulphide oxidoreductase n=1 Tax=Archaeoglobus profundus (strain DSM 5631 / JCM 9629 / NBRC 100127 / Av18) TaxID=572546 RepID=D2RFV4_ARCPA|nr:FAD-dependent oxidoreductase [Archaeoglobus profundus]ADB57179.1 FAD-dependent pyridine nucleotide-disulphide oxidoreductase [Archaeoglobus profundus DSM 5631]